MALISNSLKVVTDPMPDKRKMQGHDPITCLYLYDIQKKQMKKNQWFWAGKEPVWVDRK